MTTRSDVLTWVELDREAFRSNLRLFRERIGAECKLMIPVKANAYGHGLSTVAAEAMRAGADWLGVHSLDEAAQVRQSGVNAPILLLGYTRKTRLAELVALGCRTLVCDPTMVLAIAEEAAKVKQRVPLHIKVETGTHRQGVCGKALHALAQLIHETPYVFLEGCYTHFANIEDTTDHSYAENQSSRFCKALSMLRAQDLGPEMTHTASSAAAMLFHSTHHDMIRVGISAYGLWPSRETYVSLLENGMSSFPLRPVLSWKTIVTQVKQVPAGAFIGYGCTYRTTHDTTLAILPIGYSDGYDRGLSNIGYVLIRGQRAPIRGRVCMNLVMVEVTDIPDVQLEDEVVLLGTQGEESISAEQLASMASTINYEIVARIRAGLPRVWCD